MPDQTLGSIEATASMDNWDTLNDFISDLIVQYIPEKSLGYKLRLASEELISNIIRAANELPKENSTGVVLEISGRLRTNIENSWFILRTRDDGSHFDPQFEERPLIDTEEPVIERKIGGLGLFLIQKSVDKVKYEWIDEFNIYELWVNLETSPKPRK